MDINISDRIYHVKPTFLFLSFDKQLLYLRRFTYYLDNSAAKGHGVGIQRDLMGNNVALAKGRIRTSQANGGRIDVADADRRRQKEVDLGEVNIDARLYKPSVFYVLARGGLSWQAIENHHNFVPLILRDAFKRPF